jgi:hypothetical protein
MQIRWWWYVVMTMFEDEETQLNRYVNIMYTIGVGIFDPSDTESMRQGAKYMDSVPLRFAAML